MSLFCPDDRSRIFGIPPGADFSEVLAKGLDERLAGQPPEELARIDIFTNSERARARIVEVFSRSGARLLPRVRLLTGLANLPELDLPPPPGNDTELARQLLAMRLVRALIEAEPGLAAKSAGFHLARTITALLDEMQSADISPDALRELDIGPHASHWEGALKFLGIMHDIWPGRTCPNPSGSEARLSVAVDRLTALWAERPPQHPVIVAGSTGSRPATQRFMRLVHGLPQGALVLPGFDFDLDDRSWNSLGHEASGTDHPQFGFAALCAALDASAADVKPWQPKATPNPARNRLISMAMRPAPVTDDWRRHGPGLAHEVAAAMEGISLQSPATSRLEATAIAVALRAAVEKGEKAVLITPDGTLTRRVAAILKRWDIVPDESAGTPLNLTAPAIYLDHILSAHRACLPVAGFLSLLKHPFTAEGDGRGRHLGRVRRLELYLRRKVVQQVTPQTMADWLQAPDTADGDTEWAAWLMDAFAHWPTGPCPIEAFLARHRAAAEHLACGPDGPASTELWAGNTGEKARATLDQIALAAEAAGPVSFEDYRTIQRAVFASEQVRSEGYLPDPRVAIWGQLEARIQTADLVILGGLNEGSWPAFASPDPWLSRPMRRALGLQSPERLIGLSAHDFQQAACNQRVILSRALRDGDAPSVASRWLTRLENLLMGIGAEGTKALIAAREKGAHWETLANALDQPANDVPPAPRPCPIPPPGARPDTISVTEVERLVRDPYAIYARRVLGLRPLNPAGRLPDMRDRGINLHSVMEAFIDATRDGLPEDPTPVLRRTIEEVLDRDVVWPSQRRLWKGRLHRIAASLAECETRRRIRATPFLLEANGQLDVALTTSDLRLTAKADRIDRDETGAVAIYDYKAKLPPGKIENWISRQLPLEAIIARKGGFVGLASCKVFHLELIGLKSNEEPADISYQLDELDAIWADFLELMESFAHPRTGYPPRLRPLKENDQGDYDQLSRYGEWDDGAKPEPKDVP